MRAIRSDTARCTMIFLTLLGGVSCIGSEDGTEKSSGALLTNVSYKSGGITLQTHGATDLGGVQFGSAAYFTYVRTDNRIGVIVETNLGNGTGQSASFYFLTDSTNQGASLVVYNNQLWMFYVGQNNQIWVRRSSTGAPGSWDGPFPNPRGFPGIPAYLHTPAPVVWNGTLYVYVVDGQSGGGVIYQTHMNDSSMVFDGSPGAGYEVTNDSVTAASWNGGLYLSWAGVDSSKSIYTKHYDPALGWSTETRIPNNFGTPALFPVADGELAIVYRGNNARIYRIYSNDGVNFGPAIADNVSSTRQTPIPFMPYSDRDFQVVYTGQNGQVYTALE